jgi:hypothetical protein
MEIEGDLAGDQSIEGSRKKLKDGMESSEETMDDGSIREQLVHE